MTSTLSSSFASRDFRVPGLITEIAAPSRTFGPERFRFQGLDLLPLKLTPAIAGYSIKDTIIPRCLSERSSQL